METVKQCPCHPESESLLKKLGKSTVLAYGDMLQRTIDHARWVLIKSETEEEILEKYLDVRAWTQENWVNNHPSVINFVSVVSYGDDPREVFVSIDGCMPKHLKYPGPLFWAAVKDQRLSVDFENKEYWEAICVDE